MAGAVGLLLGTVGNAWAAGSKHLYPSGYQTDEGALAGNPGRAKMNFSASVYGGVVRARTFIYVYAKAGEQIVMGRDSAGTITVYAPGAFGDRGNEAPAGAGVTRTVTAVSSGFIGNRAQELAGAGAADGTIGAGQYAPAAYAVTQTGIHGVMLEAGTTQLDRWEVAVRASDTGTADIPGRVFTYAFAGQTGGNNLLPSGESPSRRLYSTFYYVTSDGYRYRQQMTGLDPNAFAIYANARGFLDAGQPLYKNALGNTDYLTVIQAGVSLDKPAYPIFFEDVSGSQADETLVALGIPLTPPEPKISDVVFNYPPGSTSHSYVGRGGVINFEATDVVSYQIIISAGGDYDPVNPANRVLEGSAVAGKNSVLWDGLANNGTPVPANGNASPYDFRVTGRNGEAHFPMLDAEKNFNGGPLVTQLNGMGQGSTTVYYDDRAYRTRSGVAVGTINPDGSPGHLCGGGLDNLGTALHPHITTPYQALAGIASGSVIAASPTTDGVDRHPRYWGGGTGNTSGCTNSSEFGDKMGLDLWVLQKSADVAPAQGILVYDSPDVTTRITVPSSAAPGAVVTAQIEFGNVGSATASNVSYAATLPAGLAGVSCLQATCLYNPANGSVLVTGLPDSLTSGQWVPPVLLSFSVPANGAAPVAAHIRTTDSQEPSPGHAKDDDTASTLVGGTPTTADVAAQIDVPISSVIGQPVNVPVSFRNFGPLDATGVVYSVKLPVGTAGIQCGLPAVCAGADPSGTVVVTFPSGAVLPSGAENGFVLTYTAPAVPGVVPVTASIATATAESSTANNQSTGTTLAIDGANAKADVTVSISPPATANAGTTVQVPVKFENKGPAQAAGVTYAVTIPADLSGVSCLPAGCVVSGTQITWPTGPATLSVGQSFSPSFSYTAPSTGPVAVVAAVTTTTSQSNTANDGARASTSILAPDMAVNLGGLPANVVVGQPYKGSFTCTNGGTADATAGTSCAVIDLPAGVTQGACTISPGNGPWVAGNAVAVNAVVTCEVSGQVNTLPLVRSATVQGSTGATGDSATPNNQATQVLSIASAPVTTAVPSLSEWATMALSGLLGLMGWFAARRRKSPL